MYICTWQKQTVYMWVQKPANWWPHVYTYFTLLYKFRIWYSLAIFCVGSSSILLCRIYSDRYVVNIWRQMYHMHMKHWSLRGKDNRFHVYITGMCMCKLLFNILRRGQNGRHLPHGIFKCIIVYENVRISITISLKFVPKGTVNKTVALVLIMAWCRPLNQWWLDCWRIYASIGLNE